MILLAASAIRPSFLPKRPAAPVDLMHFDLRHG